MTDITELAQSLKAAADREMICRDVAETSEIWERTVTPENILALVEALEKAQQRIAELESRTVKLPEPFELAGLSGGSSYYYADEVDAALTAQGIKWEAE
ncbi:TPA: hypothetical protein ACGTZJ_001914 [Klebsiella pneumoniae]